jgi:hypothetical protein
MTAHIDYGKVTIPPGCFDKAAEAANLKPWPVGNEEPTGDDWKDLRKALDLGPLVGERERVREAVRQINDLKATITSLNDERTALHLGADERDQLRAELAEAKELLAECWGQFCVTANVDGEEWMGDGCLSTCEALADALVQDGVLWKHPSRRLYRYVTVLPIDKDHRADQETSNGK